MSHFSSQPNNEELVPSAPQTVNVVDMAELQFARALTPNPLPRRHGASNSPQSGLSRSNSLESGLPSSSKDSRPLSSHAYNPHYLQWQHRPQSPTPTTLSQPALDPATIPAAPATLYPVEQHQLTHNPAPAEAMQHPTEPPPAYTPAAVSITQRPQSTHYPNPNPGSAQHLATQPLPAHYTIPNPVPAAAAQYPIEQLHPNPSPAQYLTQQYQSAYYSNPNLVPTAAAQYQSTHYPFPPNPVPNTAAQYQIQQPHPNPSQYPIQQPQSAQFSAPVASQATTTLLREEAPSLPQEQVSARIASPTPSDRNQQRGSERDHDAFKIASRATTFAIASNVLMLAFFFWWGIPCSLVGYFLATRSTYIMSKYGDEKKAMNFANTSIGMTVLGIVWSVLLPVVVVTFLVTFTSIIIV